ncbi:MlaD family protein [Mycolicibacterium porcinum]|uniref:MCE family protein n=1 Tax=Mycolicibacterium porcinum TaxID=39693 RepID=A0AAW5SV91_9MYCO|nr:MlaD family protein [Mycolicibacterium porcinum]MCV7386500.1 MCE family protein [Mycolicibacterium porcinum]ORB39008.1 mammalian cell entry protein [Mycolicibacterium porcinum]
MRHNKPLGALLRMALAAAVSTVLVVLIANVITQPVDVQTRTYHADFTDISGLHEGADVRVRGVRVGKVGALGLKRTDGRTLAEVTFTMDAAYSVVPATRLAIKFQALTGLRYMDVSGAVEGAAPADPITNVPTNMTLPSFDITVLFNGLQPVLATLDPAQINTFTDNVATFLAGDGGGLGPVLASIRKLTALVSDREQVISTLVNNLATLAKGVDGRSQYLVQILDLVKVPIDSGMTVLDEFRKSQMYGPDFVSEVMRLLKAAGLEPDIDIETALDKAFTNLYDNIDAVKRVPVIWENIQPPPLEKGPAPCAKGRAELPLPMDVLLNGRKVVLCNQ